MHTARAARASHDDELASRAPTIGVEPFIQALAGAALFSRRSSPMPARWHGGRSPPTASGDWHISFEYSGRVLKNLCGSGWVSWRCAWSSSRAVPMRSMTPSATQWRACFATLGECASTAGTRFLLEQPVAMAEVLVHVARRRDRS